MSRHPSVKWAQRSDKLFITVELPDAKNVKLNLDSEGKFSFSSSIGADDMTYEIDLDLYDKVDVVESKTSYTSRHAMCLVKKAESKWWSRLLKQEGKTPVFLKVDWDKWVDEEDEKLDMDFCSIDFSQLPLSMGEDFDEEAANWIKDDESRTDKENENPNATASSICG